MYGSKSVCKLRQCNLTTLCAKTSEEEVRKSQFEQTTEREVASARFGQKSCGLVLQMGAVPELY